MRRTILKSIRNRVPTLAALLAFITFTLLVAAAGCSPTPSGAAALAGTYALQSVDGRTLPDERLGGAIAGDLVLTASGEATRTVLRATSGVPGPITLRASGTYRVRGTTISFSLTPEGSTPASRWQATGEIDSPAITVRHAGLPAGLVEEVYVRVAGRG